jgi:hypothetical protein
MALGGCRLATAQEARLCPEQISVEERLSTPLEGFSSRVEPAARGLLSITFFDGRPAERVSLAPDSESQAQGQRLAQWKLAPSGRDGSWIECAYERSGVVLSRALDAKATRCQVAYDAKVTRGGLPVIRAARCE